ncbi:MAG: flagellar M-ring protein FliF [Blastochloris viridis]|uniref:Flagellar M-ring protein n=1 Tax=Blastochloris viridis TaxID=1079 RepID=A0A6N4R7U3_BLAVI|nr:MAG: flagellar M-ring protein FliF [Blastochloris viridis]
MESLLNAFRSLGPGRILALFIGIAAVIAISSLVINRAQTPGLVLLYGGLNAQEASRITDYLASQNIPNEVKGEGSVYVPSDKVGELRLQIAGQGLVGGSTTGYELFDNQSSFGTTNFVSNLNAKRALEGELARTIGTIPAVSGARVHIVLPKQNLFSREQVTPSAAIALNLGSRTLAPEQTQSIAQLVAAAVPNLSTANVTVIDQRGTLLFDGKAQNDTVTSASSLRRDIEKRYEESIGAMLERVVGSGNAVVRVTADMNLDKTTEQSELYDPTQQVVRSEQTIESSNTSTDGNGGVTGVAGNIPGGAQGGASAGGGSSENRTETTTNYEISKTVRSTTKNGGDVRKLSVAVLVSGKSAPAAPAAEGEAAAAPAYTPLSEEERARILTLVQTAIGYNADRGDKVEIVDMPFTPVAEPEAIAEPIMTKAQVLSLAQYALIVVALVVVGLLVVKPALTTLNTALAGGGGNLLPGGMAAGGAMPMMGGGGMMPMGGGEESADGGENSMIDIRSVQGRVRESAVKKVNEIIDQYPEESLGVVRTWMAGNNSSENNNNG